MGVGTPGCAKVDDARSDLASPRIPRFPLLGGAARPAVAVVELHVNARRIKGRRGLVDERRR